MPLTNYTFQQLIDFTRTSSATFVGSNGLIQSTPASVNLLTWTQEFENAAWTKNASTVTANSTAAPDGTMTADTLVETAATSGHVVNNSATVTTSAHVFSVYLKKGSGSTAPNWLQLYTGGVSAQYANFNLGTGAVGSVAAGSTATITSVGNGWYRCTLTFTPSSGGGASVAIAFTNNTDATTRGPSYAGATTSDVFAWGAQLELGSTATTYTRNVGGLFPARFDYDPVTLAPRGILTEEQRTNLVTYSEQFDNAAWTKTRASITANATTSPDGTADAEKLVEDTTAAASHFVSQNIASHTSGVAYTMTVYAKAAERSQIRVNGDAAIGLSTPAIFDLSSGTVVSAGIFTASIQNVGNGWYRCVCTGTATATLAGVWVVGTAVAGNTSYTGNGTSGIFIWGAQLEAGAFATSYIPTVASQVTRTADQASIEAPMFAPWYNQTEGTFVVEVDTFSPTGGFTQAVNDGTANNRIAQALGTVGTSLIAASGVTSFSQSLGSLTIGNPAKLAVAFKTNDAVSAVNGIIGAVDTSVTLPTVSRLSLGQNSVNASYLNGHIRRITYYPVRLLDAQLQALTA